jgi:uncharacterized membrane protein HdeD (DUF308 family)
MTPWWVVLLESIAALVIGTLLLTDTAATIYVLVVFLGIYWLISGIFDLVGLFVGRGHMPWSLLSGALGILAGIIIVRSPLWSAVIVPATLVWLLGALGIVIGILGIIRGIAGAGWGIGILGVISLLFGILLLSNLLISTGLVVISVAFVAIVGGVFGIVYSLTTLRSSERMLNSGRAAA